MEIYRITTDSACDMPEEFIKENDLIMLPLYYQIDDVIYGDEINMDIKDFYERMRNGAMPTTMGTNPEVAKEAFKKILDKGQDILHIAFSSGLSVSYNSARIAAEELREEYPNRTIEVIDTKCASMGQGLVVYYAVNMKKEGKSLMEISRWIKEHLENFTHKFTVSDLFHLHRGGRVSKTVAIVGTLINVKPILNVDIEGLLKPVSKVRGRRKSIDYLYETLANTMGDFENETVFISHGDCLEEAEYLAEKIKENTRVKNVMINMLSPTIASHAGPGTIALFYMGTGR